MSMTLENKTLEAFANFTKDELILLEHKLVAIDLQSGCHHQCLGCGADADKPRYNMPWENLVAISSGLKKIRDEKNVMLFPSTYTPIIIQHLQGDFRSENLVLFHGSDPANYQSIDKSGKKRTIWDAYSLIFKEHGKRTHFITAGWNPKNKPIQEAIEKLVELKTEEENESYVRNSKPLEYSIKPFGKLIRTEYEKFFHSLLESLFVTEDLEIKKHDSAEKLLYFKNNCFDDFKKNGLEFHLYEQKLTPDDFEPLLRKNLKDFFNNSKYVAQVVDNMRTLSKTDKSSFGAQYGCGNLDDSKKKYSFLFSITFVKDLVDYCFEKTELSVFNFDRNGRLQLRDFDGIGKAVKELGFDEFPEVTEIKIPEKNLRDNLEHGEVPLHLLKAHINYKGDLNLVFAKNKWIAAIPVSQEYLIGRAEYFSDFNEEKSQIYKTLSSMQGRNVFGEK